MPYSEISATDLMKSLKPSQLWSVVGAFVAILIGAFSLGTFVESTVSERDKSSKDSEITSLEATIITKNEENGVMRKAMSTQALMLNSMDTKARFLGQYVTYLELHDEVSKKLFADLVCAMWKKDQTDRVEFEKRNVASSVDQLLNGETPEVLAILRELNVPLYLVDQIRTVRPSGGKTGKSVKREKRRLRSQLNSALQNARIIKIVSFSDTESYELPDEIAVAVHKRSDCAP